STLPGRKQVFRQSSGGKAIRDVIGLIGEKGISGEPLLSKVMENGRRSLPAERLEESRARCQAELNRLPESLMRLSKVDPGYPVEMSPELTELRAITLNSAKM